MAVQDIYYELESDQSADADKDKRSNASLLLFTLPKYNSEKYYIHIGLDYLVKHLK